MKWELDALKMLAKNPTVPGVALRDAIREIERLEVENTRLRAALERASKIIDFDDFPEDRVLIVGALEAP